MATAAKQYLFTDPWNCLDAVISIGMVIALALRYSQQVRAPILIWAYRIAVPVPCLRKSKGCCLPVIQVHAFDTLTVIMIVPTCVRLLHVLDMHKVLGPLLQVTLATILQNHRYCVGSSHRSQAIGYQLKDVMTFLGIFGVTWISFAIVFAVLAFDAPSKRYATYSDSCVSISCVLFGAILVEVHCCFLTCL